MLLNYIKLGQGPPIVILHGLFGSLDNWKTIGRQLAEHHTVFLIDLRNHGASFHNDVFNYHAMAGDLRLLLDRLELQKPVIMGHSMGGKVAMFFAAKHQFSVKNLILVDIGPKYYPVHHESILKGLEAIDPVHCSSRGEADQRLKQHVAEVGVRQFLLKNLKRTTTGNFEWKVNLPVIRGQIENIGEELDRELAVNIPTLFIRGGASDYILDMDFDQIAQQFPLSTIETVPNAGHWVHAEAPQEFLELVNEYLDTP